MYVKHVPCGEYANRSEKDAIQWLQQRLLSQEGSGTWFLLTNLLLSLGHESLPEEIDLLVVGPTGVFVVEEKHWDAGFLKSMAAEAKQAAERIAMKAKKIAGRLKSALAFDPGFVQPRLLFTRHDNEKYSTPTRRMIEGVPIFGLAEWRDLLDLSVLSDTTLTPEQATQICQLLQPQATLSITGKARHLMHFANMEQISGYGDGFCRIYRARRRPGMERVVVHIYDLTAIQPLYDLTSGRKTLDPEAIARREYEVMQRLQKSPWLPPIFDSFQPVPAYAGELYYFSYADTSAVSLQERASDSRWNASSRILTALQSVRALRAIHQHRDSQDGSVILHRNLTPETIRVRSDNEPLLTGLHLARIPDQGTISGALAPEFEGRERYVAPEVRPVGLAGYTIEADIYALCASLQVLFASLPEDPKAREAQRILSEGMAEDPAQRLDLTTLERKLEALSSGKPEVTPVPVSCWDETTVLQFNNRFPDAMSALEFLSSLLPESAPVALEVPEPLQEQEVPRLRYLLQSYPASPQGNIETRGLDSDFARDTYVETGLDAVLLERIQRREVRLVILCGNAGDGKTALLQHLALRLGHDPGPSAKRLWDFTLPDGLRVRANLGGSAAYQGRSAQELLDEFFAPFLHRDFPDDLVHLLAINDGPLLAWLERCPDCFLKEQLYRALEATADEADFEIDPRILYIDLNLRSLAGGIVSGQNALSTEFLNRLLDRMLGEEGTWEPCRTCLAQSRCPVNHSVQLLRSEKGPLVRQRLARALQAVHLRGETHITARNLRAALNYIFFGTHYCTDLHRDPGLRPPLYFDRAFDSGVEGRQGDLLLELERFDPALDAHPMIDRSLLKEATAKNGAGALPVKLASLRRQAYFEWADTEIERIGGTPMALTLAQGRHLETFIRAGTGTDEERKEICDALCEGIARLESLPPEAHVPGQVPLKITPRTPTETAFWVNKPRERFSLHAALPKAPAGLEALHTHVVLAYRFEAGHVEQLAINAELFHLLMEIKEGYQLADARSDDVFANLSIFKQRLAQENSRNLFAWNPLMDRIFEVRIEHRDGVQKLVLVPQPEVHI